MFNDALDTFNLLTVMWRWDIWICLSLKDATVVSNIHAD